MRYAATTSVLLEAVRADVRARSDAIVDRLAAEVQDLDTPDAVQRALSEALAELTDALADGIVAHVRERRRAQQDQAGSSSFTGD